MSKRSPSASSRTLMMVAKDGSSATIASSSVSARRMRRSWMSAGAMSDGSAAIGPSSRATVYTLSSAARRSAERREGRPAATESTTNTVMAHAVAPSYLSAAAVLRARKVLTWPTPLATATPGRFCRHDQDRSLRATTASTRRNDTTSLTATAPNAAGHAAKCTPLPDGARARNTAIADNVDTAAAAVLNVNRMSGCRRITACVNTVASTTTASSVDGRRKNKPRTSGTASKWTDHGWRWNTKCSGAAMAMTKSAKNHQAGRSTLTSAWSPRTTAKPSTVATVSAAVNAQMRGSGRARTGGTTPLEDASFVVAPAG